jgi:acyl-CoA reductase-like NAD-dependent aldehyde dehydrogenase
VTSTTQVVDKAALDGDGKTLYIDGEWQTSSQTYSRVDPAVTDRVTGVFASASNHDVARAYAAAARAQQDWADATVHIRAGVLHRAADILEARLEKAAHRLTADMGKAIRDARAEVQRSVAILRYYSGELLQPVGETYPSADSGTLLMTMEQPLGIVCAITPWNFPFAIPTWKLAPALGFGNAVVWKPAEAASGSAVFLTETLVEAGLPRGVLNLITGSGRELSGALTGDQRLSGLTFTGSDGVGSKLRQAVSDRNVKVQLELGGKNPAIVLDDADLADAADQIARGAMGATGQRCTATSRVYVHKGVAARFVDLLLAHISDLQVGDPRSQTTDIGPLASAEQRDTVASYIEMAQADGAHILLGGRVDPMSCFAEPTVLSRVSPDSRLWREEIFGPVLLIAEVDDYASALAAANDSAYGLSASLFTSDIGTALDFARRSQSGLVHINRETATVEPHVPFGGIKGSSSMQREQGKAARAFFTITKTVYIRTRSRHQ